MIRVQKWPPSKYQTHLLKCQTVIFSHYRSVSFLLCPAINHTICHTQVMRQLNSRSRWRGIHKSLSGSTSLPACLCVLQWILPSSWRQLLFRLISNNWFQSFQRCQLKPVVKCSVSWTSSWWWSRPTRQPSLWSCWRRRGRRRQRGPATSVRYEDPTHKRHKDQQQVDSAGKHSSAP